MSNVSVNEKNVKVTDEQNNVIVSEISRIVDGIVSKGVKGRLQYSDGNGGFSASSRLYWDYYNELLGVGTANPLEKGDFLGNMQVRDDEGNSLSKAYRFRTDGGALDLEAGGASLYISVWSNPDFTGTQHQQLILHPDGSPIELRQNLRLGYHRVTEADYVNFGSDSGESGFGIRNNNGTMQFKNDGDSGWSNMS